MKNAWILSAILFVLAGCDTGPTEATEKENKEKPVELPFEVITIDQDGYNLPIAVPKEYLADNELNVEFNDAVGDIEVRCGEEYQLVISDLPSDTGALLERLERDLVFKYEVVEHVGDAMLYKQFLPNNERTFWHFYVVVEHDDSEYVIKDAPLSELNEYESRKIFEALLYATGQEKV